MNSQTYAQNRYTCKSYDNQRQIPHDILQRLLEVLRLSPSAINIQPWKFLIAQTAESKNKIAQATQNEHAHNATKIINSSVVIVFCSKKQLDSDHLKQIIHYEAQAGRFSTPEIQQQRYLHCANYLEKKQITSAPMFQAWLENQIYIALGMLLMAAEIEGIQATPIEGFDKQMLNQILDLDSNHLKSCVLVALGYAHSDDFNRHLAKGRLPSNSVLQLI